MGRLARRRFQDIVGGLPETLQQVFTHAGMDLSKEASKRMLDWNRRNSMHKLGEFNYSLADAGLDEAGVRERMADYFRHLEALDAQATAE